MTTLHLNAICLCLLRQLAELDEAWHATDEASGVPVPVAGPDSDWEYYPEHIAHSLEYWERADEYEDLSQTFLGHLLLMPCPQIDTSAYTALWEKSLTQTAFERDNKALWDAMDEIVRQAIALYRESMRGAVEALPFDGPVEDADYPGEVLP